MPAAAQSCGEGVVAGRSERSPKWAKGKLSIDSAARETSKWAICPFPPPEVEPAINLPAGQVSFGSWQLCL